MGPAEDVIESSKNSNNKVKGTAGSSSDLEGALAGLKLGDKDELARVTPDLEQVKDATTSTSTSIEAADRVYNFVDIEPVELWGETEKDAFTEEELINVLRSFDEEEEVADQEDKDSLDFPEGEALPELDFEVGDDSVLLAPADFTASIFEDGDIEIDEAIEEEDDEKKGEFDEDDLGLLEGLQNLNLDWKADDDEVPPFLWCQPCTPVGGDNQSGRFSLASIAEDRALVDTSATIDLSQFDKERPKLPDSEFDTLLQLSLLNLEDTDNPYLSAAEMDSLFEKGARVAPDPEEDSQLQSAQQQQQLPDQGTYHVSQRREALEAAGGILTNFVANAGGLENERSCLGHKETIFGTAFSECGKYLATASQDSTVRIWDAATNSSLTTLEEHSSDYECLRVAFASSKWSKDVINRGKDSLHANLLATAGADGSVKIWASKDPGQKNSWTCCATLDHSAFDRIPVNPDDEKDKPQVYALQWIDHWVGLPVASSNDPSAQNSFLLTSSDDFIHLWELEAKKDDSTNLSFKEVMSLNFASFHNHGYGVSICQVTKTGLGMQNGEHQPKKQDDSTALQKPFGGDRNPNNMIFVFDAVFCPANGLLGVALSDGSLRLINGRGICISIMQLPGCQSHLTSFSWDSTGTRLATCVATGHVILWGIQVHDGMGSLTTTCAAILEGGHEPGRPVFGSRFFCSDENLLLTWGVDGRLCLWDSFSQFNIHAPIATLVADSDYPIYAVDVQDSYIAVGGGGGEATFLGVPVHLYDTVTSTS